MYLKLIGKKANGENDIHLIEGDYFHWGWCENWPDEYFLPFAIGDGPDNLGDSLVMVVEVLKENKLIQSIVVFGAVCYILNENGKTIDRFVS